MHLTVPSHQVSYALRSSSLLRVGLLRLVASSRSFATKPTTTTTATTTHSLSHLPHHPQLLKPRSQWKSSNLSHRSYSTINENNTSKHMVFRDLNYIDKKPPAPATPQTLTTTKSTALSMMKAPTALITKEALLSQATGFWQRLAIHSKWALIKSYRPFTIDEISAFFSWFILSHIIWVIVGTTTFFSLFFLGINSLFTRELVGNAMGKLLMWLNPNFHVMFEDAVVPDWKDGKIEFKKVKIQTVDEPGSTMKLDLSVESIKLTLSFTKWKDLKGIVDTVEVQGLTGFIDRRSMEISDQPEVDWFDNKEYFLESVSIVDSMVHMYQPGFDEPLKMAIYNCKIPKVRVSWLLLDVLNAEDISGSLNGALFTIHKRQHQLAYVTDVENDINPWKKIMRYRLDPLDIQSIGLNATLFNWIIGGKMEILADIMPPAEEDQDDELERSSKYVVLDFKFQFHDLKAKIPSTPPVLSNGQEILSLDELKPIVAYLNNLRSSDVDATLPPLCFRIVKKLDELEDVTTLRESKLPDAIATELYIDLMKHVQEYEMEQRYHRIATWSKTIASQLLVVGLGVMA